MIRAKKQNLSGWGNFPFEICHVFRPEKQQQVAQILTTGSHGSYVSRGLGRSYGDAALNREGGIISHERLGRMLSFDPATGVLSAEAGVSFHCIIETLLPRGFFPHVTPGTRFVTLGGAIAADVHGKNHHCDGSLASCVIDFDLLVADGSILRCSRNENPDLFFATLGGMGLTGSILRASIRLSPVSSAYMRVSQQRARNLDHALDLFITGDDAYRYSVAWIDCLARGSSLGRSVLMRGNPASVEYLSPNQQPDPLNIRLSRSWNVPFNFPGFVLRPLTIKAFNARFYRKHQDEEYVVGYDQFFYPLDSISDWNRLYGRRGFIQYQAVFPKETARSGLIELLETLSAAGQASFLAVLKAFGAESGGLLSFPRSGFTLALDIPNRGNLPPLTAKLDLIVMKHGGRVYLAKDALLAPELLPTMYPNLDAFRRIKARIDPQNRFSSSQARRLKIVEGSS